MALKPPFSFLYYCCEVPGPEASTPVPWPLTMPPPPQSSLPVGIGGWQHLGQSTLLEQRVTPLRWEALKPVDAHTCRRPRRSTLTFLLGAPWWVPSYVWLWSTLEDGSVHKPPSLELITVFSEKTKACDVAFCWWDVPVPVTWQLKWRINLSTRGSIARPPLSAFSAPQVYVIPFKNARSSYCSIALHSHSFTVHLLLEAFSAFSLHTQSFPSSDHSKVWFFLLDSPFSELLYWYNCLAYLYIAFALFLLIPSFPFFLSFSCG